MDRKYSLRLAFLIATLSSTGAFAQTDPLEKNLWFNQEKTAKIKIYKAADNKFYGKVVWLKVPDLNGKPKTDMRNPETSRRNDPIVGLLILKGFNKEDEDSYEDGTIYDPLSGKTYSAKMNFNGDKLNVRGYYGISLIGKSQEWTKAD